MQTLTSTAQAYGLRTMYLSEPLSKTRDIGGWYLDYTQLSSGKYFGAIRELNMEGMQLFVASWNATLHQCGKVESDSYVFGFPIQADGEARIDGQKWSQSVLIFPGGREFDTLVPPMTLLIACISKDEFQDYLLTVEGVSVSDWLDKRVSMFSDQHENGSMSREFMRLIGDCHADPSALALPAGRAAVKQAAMEILAALVQEGVPPQAVSLGGFSRTQIVRRARDYLLSNLDEPVQIIDVCRALGISRRGLQYSFEDVLDINPMTYLRLMRLNGARRDLLNAAAVPTQVQEVVARWGFWHFSRFSAEYKKLFHELPSETLRRSLGEREPAPFLREAEYA